MKDETFLCHYSPLTHQYGSATEYWSPSSRMPKVIAVEDGKMVRSASAQARVFRPKPNCLALHKGRTALRCVQESVNEVVRFVTWGGRSTTADAVEAKSNNVRSRKRKIGMISGLVSTLKLHRIRNEKTGLHQTVELKRVLMAHVGARSLCRDVQAKCYTVMRPARK